MTAGTSQLVGSLFQDERLEALFMACAGLLCVWSIGTSYRRHRSGTAVLLAAVGLGLLGAARICDGGQLEGPVSVCGGIVLVLSHLFNAHQLRARRLTSARELAT